MKILQLFLLFLCLWPSGAAAQHAQISVKTPRDLEPGVACDRRRFKAAYRLRAVIDTVAQTCIEEPMMLEVGYERSLFYSYRAWVCDSVYMADVRGGASMAAIQEHFRQMTPGRFSWKVYKNYPEAGVATVLDAVGLGRYRCEDREMTPVWELTTDTATVMGYACQGAVTRFKGRTWYAWYTTEVPASEGPWKLCGLPGLILRAVDGAGHFEFEATGLMHSDSGQPILFTGERFEPVTRRNLDRLYERLYADPVGFLNSDPGVTVNVTDPEGNPIRNPRAVPYNLIER